ncbi:hypothetical protein ABW54_27220 [Burkholderia cenocepacia]|nr:hypothetical protein ABW54_27220 [Burkholderia cenocepacia]
MRCTWTVNLEDSYAVDIDIVPPFCGPTIVTCTRIVVSAPSSVQRTFGKHRIQSVQVDDVSIGLTDLQRGPICKSRPKDERTASTFDVVSHSPRSSGRGITTDRCSVAQPAYVLREEMRRAGMR